MFVHNNVANAMKLPPSTQTTLEEVRSCQLDRASYLLAKKYGLTTMTESPEAMFAMGVLMLWGSKYQAMKADRVIDSIPHEGEA